MVIALIALLAGCDLVANVLAKEWTQHRQVWQLVGSAAAFVALFVVLVAGLQYTELTILTFGWIVVLQTAIVLIDWARYGLTLTPGRWAAVIAIVVLQGYLVLGAPTAESASGHEAPKQPTVEPHSAPAR